MSTERPQNQSGQPQLLSSPATSIGPVPYAVPRASTTTSSGAPATTKSPASRAAAAHASATPVHQAIAMTTIPVTQPSTSPPPQAKPVAAAQASHVAGKIARHSLILQSLNGDKWFWELLSLVFGIGIVCAIAGILARYDGHVQPHWQQGITITGLVAFLSTIAKSAILLAVTAAISQLKWNWFHDSKEPHKLTDLQLFDEASRGPLGAALIIVQLRKLSIVFIGSLIIIISLAFEFAVQQAIVIESRAPLTFSHTARVGRTVRYLDETSDFSFDPDPRANTKDPAIRAVTRGIIEGTGQPNLKPSCGSERCVWPLFESLALCSVCTDVLERALSAQTCSAVGGDDNATCTLNFEKAFTFDLPFGDKDSIYTGTTSTYYTYVATGQDGNTSAEYNATYAGIDRPMFAARALNWTMATDFDDNTALKLNSAEECAVYACIKTYNITTSNNTIATHVEKIWQNKTGTIQLVREGYGYVRSQDINLLPPGRNLNDPYILDAPSWLHMSDLLGERFDGAYFSYYLANNDQYTKFTSELFSLSFSASSFADAIHNAALALTDMIQTSSQSEPVFGSQAVIATYVRVRWTWLILPFLLTALSVMFLLLTMLATWRNKTVIWKGSSLALLYHGLAERPDPSLYPLDHGSTMADHAAQSPVKLQERSAGDGWSFQ